MHGIDLGGGSMPFCSRKPADVTCNETCQGNLQMVPIEAKTLQT